MTNSNGSLEVASLSFLGALGSTYPRSPFGAYGLGGNLFENRVDNWSEKSGGQIAPGICGTETGNWIRVVTVSAAPILAALPLMAGGLAAPRGRFSFALMKCNTIVGSSFSTPGC
ncbi:hypothetical protein ABVF61_08365 [Roseibium sp. HPY-6]|uniref:hypothetical protein n=1 Tax=Roseibium sp. HPY-6 TaxID=3229852 RepID=UPI00338E7985